MIQNHFAFLGNAVLATAVLAIAQAGTASAAPLTIQTGQTDKISIVQPSQAEKLADSRSQAKDNDEKDRDYDDDDDRDDDDRDDDDDDRDDDDDDEKDGSKIKKLPRSISSAIFNDLAKRTGEDTSMFRIVKVEQQEWSNGCLGLGSEGVSCTEAIVPGYQVVMVRDRQYWVYRTNESGSLVSYDETVSQSMTARSMVLMTRQQQLMTRSQTQVRATSAQAVSTVQSSTVAGSMTSTSASGSSMSASGSSMAGTTVATSSSMVSFSDVSSTYWANSFITELTKLTIVKGFPDGSFRPDDVVTKAQFAAIVRRAFEQAKVRDAIAFRDVSSSYWAYGAIREAYEMGFFGVTETDEFNPTLRLTRLDILVALANALNYTTTTGSVETILATYTDAASIPTQYRSLIAALTERGIIVNYPSTSRLELTRVATRSELSAFVYQTLTTIGKAQSISSPYAVEVNKTSSTGSATEQGKKQHCNQGIGNGSEGCDPGNSRPHGGSNDEGGRTPGNK